MTRKMKRRLANSTTALLWRIVDSPGRTGTPFTTTEPFPSNTRRLGISEQARNSGTVKKRIANSDGRTGGLTD